MANKANFTPDEWKTLLQSPLIVGIAVSAADPSGLFGMLKESMASARALLQAEADPNADELVKAVACDFETSEGRDRAQEGVKALIAGQHNKPVNSLFNAKAIDALKALSALLAAKAPADALAYKTWLAGVAKAVAEAAPEGGFLGFGGTQVSDAEKATLAEISAALGV
jgi:NAD(P)H-dependent flavin oxidoreductase YrpB (nitropropane dioxygenase family)